MEMAEYIYMIIRSNPIYMMSWGFRNALAVKDGLRFHVNGYLHKGWVEVLYDEAMDLFRVRTLKNGAVKQEKSEVYIDCLVNVIDRMVETK